MLLLWRKVKENAYPLPCSVPGGVAMSSPEHNFNLEATEERQQ